MLISSSDSNTVAQGSWKEGCDMVSDSHPRGHKIMISFTNNR